MLLELSVAKRVGLQNRMTSELLDIMYQTCSYETAIYGKSGWCSVFTPDELRLLEYIENATAYLEDGRHRAVNRRMACPLVNSIVSFLRPNRTGPHTFVGISHAGAIKPLLATLNTHAWFSKIDFDLKASYCQRKPDAWDLSVHVSFNSNFNFVLYERKHRNASIESQCAECHKWIGNKTDQYFVLTLFNERPIALDGCSQMLCPWSEFEAQFNRLSADCDLNQICNV